MGLFGPCGGGPPQRPAHRAIARWNEDAVANGDAYYQGWMRQLNEARQRSAQLIHAQPEEIALVPNTTAGIGLVAEGYPWKEGDNAVLPDNEFPSNQYPWLNLISRGVEIRRVPTEGGQCRWKPWPGPATPARGSSA